MGRRYITPATDKGEHKVPEGHKCTLWALTPGRAVHIDDENRSYATVEVDAIICKRAKYDYRLRFIDGRTMAVFTDGKEEWAQPTQEDPEAKREYMKRERDGHAPKAHVDEGAATCFRANKGTALRLYPKIGKVVLTKMAARVAERLEYRCLQKLEFEGTTYDCAMFEDPKNHVLYGQLADEEAS